MLKICLVFWNSEPQYAYKLYAYKKNHVIPQLAGEKSSNYFQNLCFIVSIKLSDLIEDSFIKFSNNFLFSTIVNNLMEDSFFKNTKKSLIPFQSFN